MKTIIIYQSTYGRTEQYALWLAEMLCCDAVRAASVKAAALDIGEYDTVILGGGLYAGGIGGAAVLKKMWGALGGKKVAVFTVGLADPANTDYQKIIGMGFTAEQRKHIRFFHLRGGIDYSKLGVIHKIAMAMLKFAVSRKKSAEHTEEEKAFLATYGKAVDFTDRNALLPIVEFAGGKFR